ncbi:hypothetical protein RND81_09G138700 [Saponaria officinalis]|uniref:GTD-binding domain-containing protein n=1 Tax=Saponaria officinalis TaxID=3572 RepID=A0AAW1ILM3_SAPOF
MSKLCFLIGLCSVTVFYKRVFLSFVGFFMMKFASNLTQLKMIYNDFRHGFLNFGCFPGIFDVFVMLLMFLGFMFLQFRGKLKKLGTKNVLFSSCKCCDDQMSYKNNEKETEETSNEDEEINGDEDKMFDEMSLRKMVKLERRKANAARNELEKERMASSSSVNEAMTMILRLQNEKSALKIEVNRLERGVEEKQVHNQEVIQSLQWIIMKLECEMRLLHDQLRLCREKLKGFVKSDEFDQFYSSFENIDDDDDDDWSAM